MAIVWTDSCQRNQTRDTIARAYWAMGFGGGWSATGGRNNGPRNTGNVSAYPRSPVPSGDTFIGFVRHVRYSFADNQAFLQCLLGMAEQVGLRGTSAGGLQTTRNGTVLLTTGGGLVPDDNNAHGFAMKVKLHATAGTIEVWMDGVRITALDFVGNTVGQSGPTWDSFHIGQATGGTNSSWCDVLIADGTNPTGNDVHDIVIDACIDYRKADGNGYSSQFVGFDGNSVDNYLYVDDATAPDPGTPTTSDNDTVTSTLPAIDGYTVQDMPSTAVGSPILGHTVIAVARKTTTGVANMRVGSRVGSTNTMGLAQGLQQTYLEVRAHLPAISEANFNASQAVIELL